MPKATKSTVQNVQIIVINFDYMKIDDIFGTIWLIYDLNIFNVTGTYDFSTNFARVRMGANISK